jgi:hypothetical protein
VANAIVRIGGFPQGTLKGIVTDGTGMQVFATQPKVIGQVVITGEDCSFSLPTAPRNYTVHVKAGERNAQVENVSVTAGQTTTIKIHMK